MKKIPSGSSEEKLINKAFNYHSQGKILKAAEYYQQLINKGYKDHRVFCNFGSILKSLGKLREAELYQRKAIKYKPDYANAYYNLGNVLRDLGSIEEAELSTRKAIQLNPNFAEAHLNLGKILKDIGKLKEAEFSTRKAIQKNPNFAEAHLNLGTILKDIGKLKEAEFSTRKAIQKNPNFANAYYNLGIILKNLGNLEKAELSTRRALELNPMLAEAHSNLGIILKDLGNIEEAKYCWLKAYEINPKLEENNYMLAQQLYYENKYQLAINYLKDNNLNQSQTLHLGCLLCLDREKEFKKKYLNLLEKEVCNAEIGGIIAHANIIYKTNYKSSFCNEAIKYVHWDKINEDEFSKANLNQLVNYLKNSQNYSRYQNLLIKGIQTPGNLFSLRLPFIAPMKKALESKIESYKNKYQDSGQGFINNWPENYELRSWVISMKSGGFLKQHNHEYGWITGSFYLKLPSSVGNQNGGDIAFSYQGPKYPIKNKDFQSTLRKIKERDICIFPSSLFHHTIPFESKDERICFVFDLVEKL